MSKISVIVPVYNVESYLHECLDSIIGQNLKDIEIICINDGSLDGCGRIINEYAAKDARVKVIHKESNGGYGKAINSGLEAACGEYIAIVEPVDYIGEKMYDDLYAIALGSEAEVVKSAYYINYDMKNYKKIKKNNWSKIHELPSFPFKIVKHPEFLHFHPSIWSCIYKREFLVKNNIKFVETSGACWGDGLFQVQTLCSAKKIAYTNAAYYCWRKKNFHDCRDLKDFKIPFQRSEEVYSWLKENDISDENILACLYKREFAYIRTVLEILKIMDYPDCSALIKKMIARMDEKNIFENSYIKKSERRFYKALKFSILAVFFGEKIKQLRQKIIKFSFNRKERSLQVFGRVVWQG